jgi:restriction system protein
MARRRESDIEVLLDLASRLPWWLGLLLAGASWLALHALATGAAPPSALPGAVSGGFLQGMAKIGQVLLPALFLLGALISGGRRFYRRRLLGDAKQAHGTADLLGLSWQDFERLVGEAFRAEGYRVTEAQPGPDGGVDLVLRKDSELHLVQCKRWRARKVGVEIVRELYGVMAARGAAGGYVVSAGEFTPEARRFAAGRNITLWDGAALKARIRGEAVQSALDSRPDTGEDLPPCPNCGAPMVRRVARRGAQAGQTFLGCSRFPGCRGTRALDPE